MNRRAGFTLAEMAIATAILVAAIALAMSGYVYVWSEFTKSLVQNRLDVQVQLSIEQIKRDLRLTALERVFYFPEGAGPYSAISLPLARDDNGDGAIDLDANGKIIWDKTVVYHVWSGNPTQLRTTTFDPRPNLTDVQLQEQLNSVATVGNGTMTFGGSNSTTRVVFQNLFTWNVQPQGSTYDGYAAVRQRDVGRVLGSALVSNGLNTITFRVRGKNPASSGFRVGVDSIFMTPSASVREGEAMLPALSAVGATPTVTLMNDGSWSGNYQLEFPATASSHQFTLSVPNDRWIETNFRARGELHEGTGVFFDTSLNPQDFILRLDGGYGVNWYASVQTGSSSISSALDSMRGDVVRILVRGSNLVPGGDIDFNAGMIFAYFRASSWGALGITDAFVAEANVVNGVPTMDAVPGTMTRMRSQGGANNVTISTSSGAYMGHPAALSIDRTKSYLVTYRISSSIGQGNVPLWVHSNSTYQASYVISGTNSPTATDAQASTWSSRSDVYTTNAIPGLEWLWGTYMTNAVYTSGIFDSGRASPTYSTVAWNGAVPSGAYLGVKVRSGNAPDLADAQSWTNVTTRTTPGAISPGNGRYVQFQASMRSAGAFASETPSLRDLTINWAGETRIVDVGGTFTKAPNYGIFEVSVNDQPLKQGVVVNLEIFDFARGHATSNRITSAATTEVTPRNTGR